LRLLRVALNVAVCVGEWNFFDAKCSKGAFLIPFWNFGHRYRLAIGLREHKPSRLPHERGYVEFVFASLLVGLLSSERHAKPDGLFAFADVPLFVEPSFICINRAWLDTLALAFH